eukprot:scaffold1867_cov247-Pinguiococcus_pyrenoidosus.AAC.19
MTADGAGCNFADWLAVGTPVAPAYSTQWGTLPAPRKLNFEVEFASVTLRLDGCRSAVLAAQCYAPDEAHST